MARDKSGQSIGVEVRVLGQSEADIPGITRVPQGTVLPPGRSGVGGAVDALGAPVPDSVLHRRNVNVYPHAVSPASLDGARHLPGTWLYAGDFWPHFGHFLFESMARLWALSSVRTSLDGVVFISPRKRDGDAMKAYPFHERLLALAGLGDLPVRVVSQPTRADMLIVPRAGCGMGPLSAGTPEFRAFARASFRLEVPEDSPRRVYLSRKGYGLRRGGIFAEHVMESLLEQEGYAIFSPEKASIDEQIATYLGAEQVISPDSSALHFLGFVARPEQQVAIILRRVDGAVDILPQLTGFMGRRPMVIDRITGFLRRDDIKRPPWDSFAELDLTAVGQDLAEAGFIDNPDAWNIMRPRARRQIKGHYEKRLSCGLIPVPRDAEAGKAAASAEE